MYQKMYASPLGLIWMQSDGKYLTGLWFANSKLSVEHERDYIEKDLPIFNETSKWLDIYFSGQNPNFIPKYKLENLTTFRSLVLSIVTKIPYGKTTTYKKIAQEIARIRKVNCVSSQAVGNALKLNPICIIIPCHRVVGSNKKLVGYNGGINNKKKLLELENNDMSEFLK